MITWLVGENSFEVREALGSIIDSFDGMPERIDGATLTLAELPNLLMGISLLSFERLVIISEISQNSSIWEKLSDWLPRISDTIHVVFIDAKPDKRRVAYKALKEVADYKEFPVWTERDGAKAERWVAGRAQKNGIKLDTQSVRELVHRVGPDQWQLAQALTMLSVLDVVSPEAIRSVIPANPTESVFLLLEAALARDGVRVADMIRTLELHEEPHVLLGLLSSQIMALAGVTFAGPSDNPAKELAIHPFVASKFTTYAKRLGKTKVARIVNECAQADADMKRSKADPWVLIERLLLKIVVIVSE